MQCPNRATRQHKLSGNVATISADKLAFMPSASATILSPCAVEAVAPITRAMSMNLTLARWVLLGASSLTIMAATMVVPSLPLMRDHFSQHPSAGLLVPLVLTITGPAIVLSAPLAGFIADRWGRSRLLAAGLALYVLSGTSGLVLQSLEAIVAGRVVLGLAVACTMTSATALIADYWDGAERRRAFGLQASAMGFGAALFPLAGGLLALLGWRFAFAAYLLPVPLAVMAYLTLEDPPQVRTASQAPRSPFPLRFALTIFALGLLGMVALYAIPLVVPFYLRQLGYPSPVLAALTVGLPGLAAALTALNAGTVQARLSSPHLVGLAFAAMALGYGIAALSGSLAGLLAGLAMCGVGFGLNTPNLSAWLQAGMPEDLRGRAAGGYTTAVFLGQFAATFVFAFLASTAGLAGTFGVIAVACVLIAISASAMMLAFPLPAYKAPPVALAGGGPSGHAS
jgi:MFS family permease